MLSETTSDNTVWSLYLEVYLKYVGNDVNMRLAIQWDPGAAVCICVSTVFGKLETLMNRKLQYCLTTITKVICNKNGNIWGGWGGVCVTAIKKKSFNVI